MTLPTISNVSYNAASGILTLNGNNFTTTASSYKLTDLTLKGNAGGSYTLSSADSLYGTPGKTTVQIQLSAADQQTVDALLNNNGTLAGDGNSVYNLSAKAGWDTKALAISTESMTISGYSPLKLTLSDAEIRRDVSSQLSNNSLSYSGMLKILDDVARKSSISASQLTDLNTLFNNFNTSGGIQVSPYVYAISKAVIADGNLQPGSSSQLKSLIQQDFLGLTQPDTHSADPVIKSSHYALDSKPLYSAGGQPLLSDITQGHINDCFLLVSLGEVAYQNPAAILSMLTVNGNGTYGVRFYDNGVPTYITVNNDLLYTHAGTLLANRSAADIWASVIEKAYIQLYASWNTTGGDAGDALVQITGDNVFTYAGGNIGARYSDFPHSQYNEQDTWSGLKTSIIAALQNHYAVTLDSYANSKDAAGHTKFVSAHSYDITGYDAASGNFILRNPWGVQSGQNWDTSFEASMADMQNQANGNLNANCPLLVTNLSAPYLTTHISGPTGIAVDNSGNLYVVDSGKAAIEEISATSRTITTLVSGLGSAADIAVDGSGDVFYADTAKGTVNEIAAGSHSISTLLSGANGILGLAVDGSGNLYVNEGYTLAEIAAGSHKLTTQSEDYPNGLFTVDASGNFYFANHYDGSIGGVISMFTDILGSVSITAIATATDRFGNFYFTDNGDSWVYSSANTGALYEVAAGSGVATKLISGLNNPSGLTLDKAGNIYITDAGNNSVEEFTHSNYVLNSQHPVTINDLLENTQQLTLPKSIFNAFAAQSQINANNLSNAASPQSSSDFLYYNANNGGLYYDAYGSTNPNHAVEIAVIGINSHPAALSIGDFQLGK
jgi:sugar lactone lactonase YvrE